MGRLMDTSTHNEKAVLRGQTQSAAAGETRQAKTEYHSRDYSSGPLPSFADVEPAMRGHWPDYLASIGIDPTYLLKKNSPCPICGGRDRFDFDDKQDRGTSYCRGCEKARDGFTLASEWTGHSMTETLADVAQWVGVTRGTYSPRPTRRKPLEVLAKGNADDYQRKRETARRILTEAKQSHPLLTRYLASRGINLASIPSDLLLHPACKYFDAGKVSGTYPAMVAPIRDLVGRVVGLHRTYLAADGSGKAAVDDPKKMMALWSGSTRGGVVRFAEAADGLIVCEGIETGLALLQTTGRPVWCALSAGGLEHIEIPPSVVDVVIAGDNDSDRTGQGEKSAQILADRLAGTVANVTVNIPPEPGDWLDVLTREAGQ